MDRETPTLYARYLVGLMLFVSIVAYSDRLILGFLIDPIKADLGLTDTQAGLLTGLAFSVFYAIMGLPLGRAVDVFPRNIVLSACITAWSLCTALCGLAVGVVTLFLARCGIGAGEAAMNPAAVSLISDHYPRSRVVGAIAVYSVGIVGGGGLAIILGGQLVAYLTALGKIDIGGFQNVPAWRLVFIAMGLPGLVAALLVLLTVKDRQRTRCTASEARSGRESTREVFSYFNLPGNRRVYAWLYGGLVAFGFYNFSVLSWYPAMFGRTFGATPAQISVGYGVAYLASGVCGALASAPAVRYFHRRGDFDGPAKVLLLTSTIALVPAILGPLMPTFELTISMFLLSMLMSAAQNSMAFTSFVMITPPHRRGVVVATYVMTMNLTGGSFGGVLVGLLTDNVFGPEHLARAIAVMAAVFLPISILCFAKLRTPYEAAARREEERHDGDVAVRAERPLDAGAPAAQR